MVVFNFGIVKIERFEYVIKYVLFIIVRIMEYVNVGKVLI